MRIDSLINKDCSFEHRSLSFRSMKEAYDFEERECLRLHGIPKWENIRLHRMASIMRQAFKNPDMARALKARIEKEPSDWFRMAKRWQNARARDRCILMQYPNAANWNGIMFVGEAPGADEEYLGQPFVGKAGNKLTSLLRDAKVKRDLCLITNVFHIRPPANRVAFFFTREEKFAYKDKPRYNGMWLQENYVAEIKRLEREIAKWKPRVIVALGAVALWALCHESKITQHVGQTFTFKCQLDKSVPVVVCYHPSYLLRLHSAEKDAEAVEAIAKAKRISI